MKKAVKKQDKVEKKFPDNKFASFLKKKVKVSSMKTQPTRKMFGLK